MIADLPYREIWLVDFEFTCPPGERPEPACLVAWELRCGRKIRLWRDQFGPLPPYPLDANSLFVAYFASAEMSCHRALGWPMPARILDLFHRIPGHDQRPPRPRRRFSKGIYLGRPRLFRARPYRASRESRYAEEVHGRQLQLLVARRARGRPGLLRNRRGGLGGSCPRCCQN